MFFAILLLAFYITKPFLPALFTAAIIAYLSHPLYKRLLKFIKKKNIAALLVSIFVVLLITLPFILVIGLIFKEARETYVVIQEDSNLDQHSLGANFLKVVCRDERASICKSAKSVVALLPQEDLDYYMKAAIKGITSFIMDNISKFLKSIPSFLLSFFVMMFVVYYLLKDGEVIAKRIRNILPLEESHKQNVFSKFHDITYAVFYGNISVAIIQGIVGSIGFFALGLSSPILWGFVMMFFALMPYFGTALIWLPAALNLIFMGYLQNDNSTIVRGVILIGYGVFVISSIDNILKPKIIGQKADIHPILVLLGILGGLNLFGLIGIILGPVMLALLMTFVQIYEEEKAQLEKYF